MLMSLICLIEVLQRCLFFIEKDIFFVARAESEHWSKLPYHYRSVTRVLV
jgi:hypothetical protein